MSTNRNEIDPKTALALAAVGLGLLGIFAMSRSIGADFFVLLKTLFAWLACAGGLGALLWLGIDWVASLLGSTAFAWVFSWPLLDSMANGGKDSESTDFSGFLQEIPFWDTRTFKFAVLGILVAALFYRLFLHRNR